MSVRLAFVRVNTITSPGPGRGPERPLSRSLQRAGSSTRVRACEDVPSSPAGGIPECVRCALKCWHVISASPFELLL